MTKRRKGQIEMELAEPCPPYNLRIVFDSHAGRQQTVIVIDNARTLIDKLKTKPQPTGRHYALTHQDLSGLDLSGLDLSRVDFTGSRLCNVNLHGSKLSKTILDNCDLSGARISKKQLRQATGLMRRGPSGEGHSARKLRQLQRS